jgi:hypothetical protein
MLLGPFQRETADTGGTAFLHEVLVLVAVPVTETLGRAARVVTVVTDVTRAAAAT